jgi:4-amino-4-deoxy-L-arabinose transferase-like glycosyltransferase
MSYTSNHASYSATVHSPSRWLRIFIRNPVLGRLKSRLNYFSQHPLRIHIRNDLNRGLNGYSYFSRLAWLFLLSGIFVIYAVLSLYQINLPGLHYDEAFEAVPALQLLQNQTVTTFRSHGLTLGGQTFPLMTQDYIGAINTYLAIPFIAIFGPTPAALRVMSILIGAVTLWLAYALSSQLTGSRWVGLTAALLLSVEPTFIFWNRQGIFVTAITATIGLAATLCWLRCLRSGSPRWAMAGAFLFGLGLYAKLLFLWLIVALASAAILLNLSQSVHTTRDFFRETLRFPPKKEIFTSLLTFSLGCWPLIVYNIQTDGTFLNITENAKTSYYGINNLAFGSNLLERLKQFIVMLNGGQLWYLGDIWSTPLPSLTFGGLLILITPITMRRALTSPTSDLSPAKIALFPFLVITLVILTSIATVSALWPTHFALLMPWPAIAIAIGGWFLFPHTPKKASRLTPHVSRITYHVSRFMLWTGLCLLVSANLFTTIRYHTTLTQSGGLGSHSDAIYDLSKWLANPKLVGDQPLAADQPSVTDHTRGPVAAMDWGLAAPVTYLTAGRVTPVEVFGYAWESDVELTARLEGLIANPATLYLWRAPEEIIFDRSDAFKALYRPLNLVENIEAAFYERSGRPVLGVTRLVKCGTPDIISPEPAEHCP